MKRKLLILLLLALPFGGALHAAGRCDDAARRGKRAAADQPAATDQVRNIIYLIGDGMGLAQVSMLQIENGYEPTAFNRAEHVALISTYSANNRVTDSAAAGTALAAGAKTNNSMLGVDPSGAALTSMIARATAQGMPTGVVVSCYLQHATPGAFFAHVRNRGESEKITAQMLTCDIDVLAGGGAKWMKADSGEGGDYFEAFARRGYRVGRSLDEVADHREGRLLVVAADEHLPQAPERGDFLPRATAQALDVLAAESAKRGKGFVMMVEGSQIDMACHANDAAWLLAEMRDFNEAVAVAMDFADRNPGTLVVITADHETGGVTIPSGKSDFTLSDSGVEYRFGTGSHTGTLLPVYLYGTGSDRIAGMLDNTELSQQLMELLGL